MQSRFVLPLLLAGIIGVLIGLSGYTFYYAHGLSYLSNDPSACANCHIMRAQYDGWLKGSHQTAATCNDCHVPHDLIPKYLVKMENGFWHSKGFTLQDFPEPIRMRPQSRDVLIHNCVYCHETAVSEITAHISEADEPMDCTVCHRDVGHGPNQ